MRQINPPGKYVFLPYAEQAGFNALSSININIDVTNKNTARGPTSINQALRSNPEYAIGLLTVLTSICSMAGH